MTVSIPTYTRSLNTIYSARQFTFSCASGKLSSRVHLHCYERVITGCIVHRQMLLIAILEHNVVFLLWLISRHAYHQLVPLHTYFRPCVYNNACTVHSLITHIPVYVVFLQAFFRLVDLYSACSCCPLMVTATNMVACCSSPPSFISNPTWDLSFITFNSAGQLACVHKETIDHPSPYYYPYKIYFLV